MKKTITTLCLILTVSIFGNLQANNGNELARAKAALISNCKQFQPFMNEAFVNISQNLDGSTTYSFSGTPCPPHTLCLQVIILYGTVTIDANGDVTQITCAGGVVAKP